MSVPTTDDLQRERRIRTALIHEVHHRVKNNLQTVESLLRIHLRRVESPEARDALQEASSRLRAMAIVHEMLSEAPNDELDLITLTREIAEQVRRAFTGDDAAFAVHVEGGSPPLCGSMATSMALVVAEIVHNSFEHGFAGRNHGTVRIAFESDASQLRVTIADDGCGLPRGFSLHNPTSMGLTLMKTLVEDDLQGSLQVAASASGACFHFTVPHAVLAPSTYTTQGDDERA